MIDPGMEYIPPPSANLIARKKLRIAPPHIKREAESEDDEGHEREDDFEEPVGQSEGPSLSTAGCVGTGGPERRRITHPEKADGAGGVSQSPRFSLLSLYERGCCCGGWTLARWPWLSPPQAKRLHRKLLVRQAKRQRGLPLLDIDRAISATLSLWRDLRRPGGGATDARRGIQHHSVSFWHRLMGAEGSLDQSIKSPYTSRILKPYIRRDYESRPVKLRLLAEIRAYSHRKDPDWVPEPNAPIDYCYVRPNHIPSVNAMRGPVGVSAVPGRTSVWLSSIRKSWSALVSWCRIVKYNEAYISFLLVHPEWRRAGIGTFMIYHLIQTCMGKDVTLHVSASNPAMLLYQKFGFKAEEYILDFYDKYYPVGQHECRHAFFLRLRR
ncbi:Cysteine-rich protein 2-binding protein [Larimichthys crocea]|uniref:Cysteine-rich protein 2-binding protein n=1 Tax=Larimichthys crocea TaxID=215358 RepID=A0A6G0J8K0_LARCR|nr:Cysteine-rich protein 2-binding protein [Larimichthys crocea]